MLKFLLISERAPRLHPNTLPLLSEVVKHGLIVHVHPMDSMKNHSKAKYGILVECHIVSGKIVLILGGGKYWQIMNIQLTTQTKTFSSFLAFSIIIMSIFSSYFFPLLSYPPFCFHYPLLLLRFPKYFAPLEFPKIFFPLKAKDIEM